MHRTPESRHAWRQRSLLLDMERAGWLLLAFIALIVGVQMGRLQILIQQQNVKVTSPG